VPAADGRALGPAGGGRRIDPPGQPGGATALAGARPRWPWPARALARAGAVRWLRSAVEGAEDGADITYAWGRVESKGREYLSKTHKWTVADRHRIEVHASTVPLNSIASVMRGIATGNNKYFTLTDAEREDTGIEEKYLLPFIGKTRDCLSLAFTQAMHDDLREAGKKAWLFYCQETQRVSSARP